jgi:hypothetical protein
VPISDAFDIVGNYGYGKSGRLDSILGLNNDARDFTNYWQRHWYVGMRLKRLFARTMSATAILTTTTTAL